MIVCFRCHHPGCGSEHLMSSLDIPDGTECEKCGKSFRLLMRKCDYQHEPGKKVQDASCPVCPHCGEFTADPLDWSEMGLRDVDGSETEVDCGSCEREFVVTTHVHHTFTTEPVEERAAA